MKTNNQQGRNIALVVGIYFIIKSVINLILGGGILDVIISVVEAVALYTGLMYLNYVVAVIVGIVVVKNLWNNISNFGDNWFYLLEGVIDIICVIVICLNQSVKEHFTNKWGGSGE